MKKFDINFNGRACEEAQEWYKLQESFENAWNNCHRGDWMLWMASKLKVDIRAIALAKGKCAETVIHLMKDERSKKAVQAAIDFGMMKIDIEELNTAAAAAAAADAASAATYAYAAAARKENRLKTANICREILAKEVFEKIREYEQ
jgi:hypothetical protein